MSKQDPPEKDSRPPPRPPTLGYRVPSDEGPYQPRTPKALQALAGFAAWAAAVGTFWAVYQAFLPVFRYSSTATGMLAGAILLGLIGLGITVHRYYGWHSFIPGIFIGITMTCLVPLGIVAVICFGGAHFG